MQDPGIEKIRNSTISNGELTMHTALAFAIIVFLLVALNQMLGL
jgi:hypothetical protein